jgi:small-conductance mechanosensitive channel
MRIMQEQAEAHPLHVDNRTPEEKKKGEPVVVVRLLQFTDSAMTLRAWVWTTDPTNAFILKCDLLKSIKQAFDKEGIEVPYPHRMVFLQNQNEIRS